MRTKAEKRSNDRKHAARKYHIYRDILRNGEYADELVTRKGMHYFSKRKVHCSCPLCSAKTGRDGYTIADLRNIQRVCYVES